MARYFQELSYDRPVAVGEPVPWFIAPAPVNPRFSFSAIAGRWILLTFFGEAADPRSRTFLEQLAGAGFPLSDRSLISYGVTTCPDDQVDDLVVRAFPANRTFLDADQAIARRYGLLSDDPERDGPPFNGRWFLIDPDLRVYGAGSFNGFDKLKKLVADLPPPGNHTGMGETFAPVLVLPRVVRQGYCDALIETYEKGQPETSGFMRQVDGKTVRTFDNAFKRRKDVEIRDEVLRRELRRAVSASIMPAIHKAYQFEVSRVERYIVARYDASEGGFFKAHRDNTTMGTAHRRFAVTINLNAEDYDGGDLRFPEYGMRTYRAPTGGAVVFSCALLHEALPVTRGTRYATLPFLYDDAAAIVREENAATIDVSARPDATEGNSIT